jgi:hypothetical protein
MGDVIVRSSSKGLAVNDGPSVLGEQQAKIRVGGKIRPGIKVLTSAAKNHPKAQGIYDAGVNFGMRWDDIEAELIKQCGFDKSPLTPKNVQYFSVFRGDFDNPVMADQIMQLYGQDVDGKRRLLRFPIILPTDSWQTNLPHALRCYSTSGLQYWSDYDPEGNRRCFTRKPVEKHEHAKRAVRKFGGRETIPRPDTQGVCSPDVCPQYQDSLCNLTADLLFFIPGIVGAGAIALPFKSFYGMEQIRQTMTMVAFLRKGRIGGVHNDKPIFYVTKKLQDVPMLDRATGKPTRKTHWILTLEADIDMLTLFQGAEKQHLLASQAGGAAALALSAPVDHDDDDEDAIEGSCSDPETTAQPQQTDPRLLVKAARAELADTLKKLNIVPEVFGGWMSRQTENAQWSHDLDGLAKAKEFLSEPLAGNAEQWKKARSLDAPF